MENMRPSNLSEKSEQYSSIILTTKVIQVLQAANRGEALTDIQIETLKRGVSLLSGIMEGSAFVEKENGSSGLKPPTQEALTMYGYALLNVRRLDLKSKGRNVMTDYFSSLLKILESLEKKRVKNNIDLYEPNKFFLMLGDALREDIQQEDYMPQKDIFLTQKQLIPNVSLLS